MAGCVKLVKFYSSRVSKARQRVRAIRGTTIARHYHKLIKNTILTSQCSVCPISWRWDSWNTEITSLWLYISWDTHVEVRLFVPLTYNSIIYVYLLSTNCGCLVEPDDDALNCYGQRERLHIYCQFWRPWSLRWQAYSSALFQCRRMYVFTVLTVPGGGITMILPCQILQKLIKVARWWTSAVRPLGFFKFRIFTPRLEYKTVIWAKKKPNCRLWRIDSMRP